MLKTSFKVFESFINLKVSQNLGLNIFINYFNSNCEK